MEQQGTDPSDFDLAMTASPHGLTFTPAPPDFSAPLPDADSITASLPDGTVVEPQVHVSEGRDEDRSIGFIFDPLLPDDSVIRMHDRFLITIEPR